MIASWEEYTCRSSSWCLSDHSRAIEVLKTPSWVHNLKNYRELQLSADITSLLNPPDSVPLVPDDDIKIKWNRANCYSVLSPKITFEHDQHFPPFFPLGAFEIKSVFTFVRNCEIENHAMTSRKNSEFYLLSGFIEVTPHRKFALLPTLQVRPLK